MPYSLLTPRAAVSGNRLPAFVVPASRARLLWHRLYGSVWTDSQGVRKEKRTTWLTVFAFFVLGVMSLISLLSTKVRQPGWGRTVAQTCVFDVLTFVGLAHQFVRRSHELNRWIFALTLDGILIASFLLNGCWLAPGSAGTFNWIAFTTTFLLLTGAPIRRVNLLFAANTIVMVTLCFAALAPGQCKVPLDPLVYCFSMLLLYVIPQVLFYWLLADLMEKRLKAENTDMEKTVFISRMSHEMRTPLNGILPLLRELEAAPSLSADQLELVRTARHSADILLNLVDDVLDFSKLQGKHLTLAHQPFDLRQCVARVHRIFGAEAARARVQLRFDIADEVRSAVQGDSLRLSQVLINLIRNSLKFVSASTGVVTVTVRCLRGGGGGGRRGSAATGDRGGGDGPQLVLFSVSDNGIGISPEEQAKLFTPFYQVPGNALTERGTGLGLCISRDLVQQMGGQLVLRSKPGEGTTVEFSLPLARPGQSFTGVRQISLRRHSEHKATPCASTSSFDVRTQQPEAITESLSATHLLPYVGLAGAGPVVPPRFLVVDDNSINCLVLKRVLLAGFTCAVDTATSGADALRLLAQAGGEAPYHCALVDVHMPEMDGLELTRRLLQRPPRQAAGGWGGPRGTGGLVVVGVTADVSPAVHAECLAAGMALVVTKPVSASELTDRLCDLLPWADRHRRASVTVAEAPTSPASPAELTAGPSNPLDGGASRPRTDEAAADAPPALVSPYSELLHLQQPQPPPSPSPPPMELDLPHVPSEA